MAVTRRQSNAISVEDFKSMTSGWSTESEFVDFIEVNIERLCTDILGGDYKSHQREWALMEQRMFGGNKPRIDMMIELKDGRRIGIECKRPKNSYSELSSVVSQLMCYSTIAEDNGLPMDEMYLLTTQYHNIVDRVIKRFNIPIKVVIFSRNKRLESTW